MNITEDFNHHEKRQQQSHLTVRDTDTAGEGRSNQRSAKKSRVLQTSVGESHDLKESNLSDPISLHSCEAAHDRMIL